MFESSYNKQKAALFYKMEVNGECNRQDSKRTKKYHKCSVEL